MAILVVGGSGRGVGKTSLICGLIAALPEMCWSVVKISSHVHGKPDSIWGENALTVKSYPGTDTARYLAAGAKQAFLVSWHDEAPEERDWVEIFERLGVRCDSETNWIFESNAVLDSLRPDVCFMVQGPESSDEFKPSYLRVVDCADAVVRKAEKDGSMQTEESGRTEIRMKDFESLPPEMLIWVRSKLNS